MAQIALMAVGSLAALNRGAQARKLKYQQAEGLDAAANRRMAATTADVAEAERKKKFMYSRALAIAAASGAGVDDAGMVALLGDLNAEGEYRVMSKLWVGQQETEGLRFRAEAARREGESALEAGYLNAVTSVISSYGQGAFEGFSQSSQMAKGTAATSKSVITSGVTGQKYMVPDSMIKDWGGNIPIGILNRRGIRPIG